MKAWYFSALAALVIVGCAPQRVAAPPTPASSQSQSETPTAESLAAPRIPVGADKKVIQTLASNLDQDAAEEQILILQSRSNLILPATVQVADYDEARKTYYLAWEGSILASASQPMSLTLDDLVGDHQQAIVIQGLDETGHPTLDVLRLVPSAGGLGMAYRSIFSRVSRGTVEIESPIRPESYSRGQNSDISAAIVTDEPDPLSKNSLDTVRSSYNWLFQKGEYVLTGSQRYRRAVATDAALEKLYSSETSQLEAFFQGPWVKAAPDKSGFLILFFDPATREVTFASSGAQEVYRWEVSSRSTRSSVYIVGSNDLINLIKLQMSVTVTAIDTLEVNAQDNPLWSGSYKKLDPSAARVLARQGTGSLVQDKPPTGLYRNEKGDEFDFQVPEVRLKLAGVTMVGSVAVYPLGRIKVLQVKVPSRPGAEGFSRAYSMVAKEETSANRVVRTLRLQGGSLNSLGWLSDQSDPIRLEQVEGTVAPSR